MTHFSSELALFGPVARRPSYSTDGGPMQSNPSVMPSMINVRGQPESLETLFTTATCLLFLRANHIGILMGFVFFVTIQLKKASGGKVCHLESRLRMRFAPRSSGQITSAFKKVIHPNGFL